MAKVEGGTSGELKEIQAAMDQNTLEMAQNALKAAQDGKEAKEIANRKGVADKLP